MYSNPTAEFHVISYAQLTARDPSAISTLHSAATEEGFFYLDLTKVPDSSILGDVSSLTRTSEALFDLPISDKMSYDTNRLGTHKNYGYKPIGRNTGVAEGRRDGHELFLTPRDVLFGLGQSHRFEAPTALSRDIHLLKRFADESHQICLTVLKALSLIGGLEDIADHHRGNHSSTSAVALLKYPYLEEEDNHFAGHISHTDVGSLTLLFCDQDGLQVMHPTSGQWENVEPRPGHAIVNIGDSLHHLSSRVLKSALHRVLPNTSKTHSARYSVIYFMRPEQTATFTDENAREWKSIDWHTRKFNAFSADRTMGVQQILDGRV